MKKAVRNNGSEGKGTSKSADERKGKALDAALAERIMGWSVDQEGKKAEWWTDAEGKRVRLREGWCPSSEIGDAWSIHDRLSELGWSLTLIAPGGALGPNYLSDRDPWEAILFRTERNREVKAEADSAPLAISRAALAAEEMESERIATTSPDVRLRYENEG